MGCRQRAASSELLRVVVGEVEGRLTLIPDPRHRAPGRGAHLHRSPECLDQAERRRAFPRALRATGPLDLSLLRAAIGGDPG